MERIERFHNPGAPVDTVHFTFLQKPPAGKIHETSVIGE